MCFSCGCCKQKHFSTDSLNLFRSMIHHHFLHVTVWFQLSHFELELWPCLWIILVSEREAVKVSESSLHFATIIRVHSKVSLEIHYKFNLHEGINHCTEYNLLFEVFLDGLAFIHGAMWCLYRINKHLVGERTDQMLRYKLWHRKCQFLE